MWVARRRLTDIRIVNKGSCAAALSAVGTESSSSSPVRNERLFASARVEGSDSSTRTAGDRHMHTI